MKEKIKRIIGGLLVKLIQSRGGDIIFPQGLRISTQIKIMKMIIKHKKKLHLKCYEAYQLFKIVKSTEGNIVEVGVYKGGSAKIICEAKGNKNLYLFDTFSGLPKADKYMPEHFYKGKCNAGFKEVKEYLKEYPNVFIYKGLFPSSAKPIENKTFGLVHLDVDIYKSTIDCLNFFYPKMNKGGIIISHDYTYSIGVKKAFDEFFKDKPETIIELLGYQCLIVKLKNEI